MPYIDPKRRREIEPLQSGIRPEPGELNYLITQLCLDHIDQRGKRYATINEVIGVLECVKLEFYRRLVVPYENQKIAENGDVYT